MTNEEKRNIYNNIQNLYNMDFTTWQEVLAQLYNLVADIDQKFDVFKEKFELMLGKEVANKLEEMYKDGSLEKLLNTQTLERIKQELLQIITTNKTEFDNFKNEINEQLDTIVKNNIIIDMFPKIQGELNDTNRFKRAIEYLKTVNGGTLNLRGETYTVNKINIASNIDIIGVGNTTIIKHENGATDYQNIFEVNNCENWSIKNLAIDGNRINQSGVYKHGIYTLDTKHGVIENVAIKDVFGEGFMIGYSDYLSQDIKVINSSVKNCARNEVCIAHADGVVFDNVYIEGVDSNSATLDIEKHKNGDIHKNIIFKDCKIKCGTEPIKLISNGYIGDMSNVIFDNCNVNGKIALQKFNNVIFRNHCICSTMEIIGSSNIDLGDIEISNPNGTGLYIYKDGSTISTNINSSNINIHDCETDGVILQDVQNISLINPCIINNGNGISLQYATTNVNIVGGKITDTRTAKLQKYAIDFVGTTYNNITLNNVYTLGNLTSEFNNLIKYKALVNAFANKLSVANTTSNYALDMTYDENANFNIPTEVFANAIGILKQQTASSIWKNGVIFEDTDGKLKYKNRAGTIQILSN